VLKENGIATPEGMTIKVLEDTASTAHLILPEPPAELSEAELDQLAAGTLVAGMRISPLPSTLCGKAGDPGDLIRIEGDATHRTL
jgi:hypothetical protein